MRITAVVAHKNKFHDPVCLSPQDRLVLGKPDTEYPGWIWVRTPSGNEGWTPISAIQIISNTVGIAKESYSARELNTAVGETLILHRERDDWLWVENEMGECGWIPKKTTSLADASNGIVRSAD